MTMIEQILSELELNVQDIDIFAAAIGRVRLQDFV